MGERAGLLLSLEPPASTLSLPSQVSTVVYYLGVLNPVHRIPDGTCTLEHNHLLFDRAIALYAI